MQQATLVSDSAPVTKANERQIVQLNQLVMHHGHDRTQFDLRKLAGLTLQIVQRDIDTYAPIVAARIQTDADNQYKIVSGHRRFVARILAYGVLEWSALPDNQAKLTEQGGIDTAFVEGLLQQIVQAIVPQAATDPTLGFASVLSAETIHQTIVELLKLYGTRETEIVLFDGSPKAQLLALQAANSNRENPDPLGLAQSYLAAVEAGATPQEIARNSGISAEIVLNHLALTELPPELAAQIANGNLPISIARIISSVPVHIGDGLAAFVLQGVQASRPPTVKQLKQTAKRLKTWEGIQLPMTGFQKQSQRNIARCLATLWQQSLSADPVYAWSAAAEMASNDSLADPWLDRERTLRWFQLLDTAKTYVQSDGSLNWNTIVETLLTTINCTTCPIGNLPRQRLHSDIGGQRDDATGMPCRFHPVGEHSHCLHGYTPNDPLQVPVPFDWATHTGIIQAGGSYHAPSWTTLEEAWKAQQAAEAADAAQLAKQAADTAQFPGVDPNRGDSAETQNIPATSPAQPAAAAPSKPKTSADSHSQKQIRAYMQRHTKQNSQHPFATPCATCQHKLETSPVKSKPKAPHCAWAKGSRAVSFTELTATDDKAGFESVSICRQYAPQADWQTLIPPYPQAVTMPRLWIVQQIELFLALAVSQSQPTGHAGKVKQFPLEFLTGRPMASTASHSQWAKERFSAEQGNLSLQQLWTLYIWTVAEYQRVTHNPIVLPVNGQSAQFVAVKEEEVTA